VFGFWKFFAPIVNFFAPERNLSRILPGALPPFSGHYGGSPRQRVAAIFFPRGVELPT